MTIDLFRKEDARNRISDSIHGTLTEAGLSIVWQDFNPANAEFFGRDDDEDEYTVTLDKENTQKLFQAMDCSEKSDEEKLVELKRFFQRAYTAAFKKYCDKHKISYDTFNWP